MRSRTGCLTCRQRKLKCDEQKPSCSQCLKSHRECKPSPGVVFRHQQNASLNSGSLGSLDRFYGYKESFGDDSIWVKIPKHLEFVHISDPYSIDALPDGPSPNESYDDSTTDVQFLGTPRTQVEGDLPATYGLEALSSVAVNGPWSVHGPSITDQISPLLRVRQSPQTHGSAQDLSFILNQSPEASAVSPIDPRLKDVSFDAVHQVRHRRTPSQTLYNDDEDVYFLLRRFSEGPGHWMDLFDLGRFFEMDVPIKAATCPMLLNSAIALAAKNLARLEPSSAKFQNLSGGQSSRVWMHRAATYYDKAINHLRQVLEAQTVAAGDAGDTAIDGRWSASSSNRPADVLKNSLPKMDSDEMVGTTAILCVYEFLDGSDQEWSRHLDGAKSLFDIAKDGVLAMSGPPSPQNHFHRGWRPSVNSRVAVFWNIARQDMLDAFINHSASRLDTSDIAMWRSVGLHIAQTGYIIPSNRPQQEEPVQDDMICNALVWLVMKLVNFIATTSGVTATRPTSPTRWTGVGDDWPSLCNQFDIWFDGLPDGFRPVSASWSDRPGELSTRLPFPKKWFVRPMCASTMQWYHFARILLLRYRPQRQSDLLQGGPDNHETRAESKEHANEIISIGLAQTDEGVLVHSVQPLYAAGQALLEGQAMQDRTMSGLDELRLSLVDHMRWIQDETGWATEYRVKSLFEQWQWKYD